MSRRLVRQARARISSVQFSAYAQMEQKLLASPEKDRRLAWWEKYLHGVWTPLELPQDREAANNEGGDARAGLVTEILDSATVASARRFARECQATAFAVFGALFQALLSRYSGQSDILFLTPHANRTENTEAIMGPLADPICLAGHIGAETTFRQLVTRFGEESMDAMERALPLNLVTPLVDMRVGRQYHPLNQITFFYQRAFVHEMQWKGLEIDALPDVPAVTGSEWQLGVVERNSGVYLEFLYDATLYSEATIQIVQRHFARSVARSGDDSGQAFVAIEVDDGGGNGKIFDGRVCAACHRAADAASKGDGGTGPNSGGTGKDCGGAEGRDIRERAGHDAHLAPGAED